MAQGSGEERKRRRVRPFAWWYTCTGLGFALLGIRNWIAHAAPWSIGLRFVIAAGFVLLGWATLRSVRPPGRRRGNGSSQ